MMPLRPALLVSNITVGVDVVCVVYDDGDGVCDDKFVVCVVCVVCVVVCVVGVLEEAKDEDEEECGDDIKVERLARSKTIQFLRLSCVSS